jgi:acetoin utilization protein AcuC
MSSSDRDPLVVYGPANNAYDFGPGHPFTPRRFGPGIDLLRELGADAEAFVAPTPASDAELATIHTRRFLASIERLSDYPEMPDEEGVTDSDTPPFYGMHEAGAAVVGGTLRAMDEILAGRRLHAFHPGGGLHHAFPARASGFCVFNDVAVAIRRARDAGHRVLYVDVDVHHGDGVEGIFWDDPLVQTVSIHESGLTLFPGSGWVEDRGGEGAEGSAVNIPLEHGTSDASWLAVLESVVPAVAAAFRPTLLVTLNGSDAHAFDPLANLQLTTIAFARAARLLDGIAHQHTEGRWLATGGGGYDVYRAVPRNWGLVWLAQAHREVPAETPPAWQERWAAEAARHRAGPPATLMLDPVGTGRAETATVAAANRATADRALERTLHILAERHGA